jgi:hypothetical protein
MTPTFDPTIGAARQTTQIDLGGPCTENESNVSVGTSLTTLANNNPDRVGLVFVNNGAADVLIGLTSAITSTIGIRLTANGGSASLTIRDDFTLCARQWSAISSAPGNSVYVLEIIRLRQTQQPQGVL